MSGVRSNHAYDYTWKSQKPPTGFPAEFVDRESCETWQIGESTESIRQVKNDKLIVTTYTYADDRELAVTIGYDSEVNDVQGRESM